MLIFQISFLCAQLKTAKKINLGDDDHGERDSLHSVMRVIN